VRDVRSFSRTVFVYVVFPSTVDPLDPTWVVSAEEDSDVPVRFPNSPDLK
jgi:hypothetical protein